MTLLDSLGQVFDNFVKHMTNWTLVYMHTLKKSYFLSMYNFPFLKHHEQTIKIFTYFNLLQCEF